MKTLPDGVRWLFGLLAGLCGAVSAQSSMFNSTVAADAWVTSGPDGSLASKNYGGAGTLAVAASGLSEGPFATVLRFDVSSAAKVLDNTFGAGQWSVEAVLLQLTIAPADVGMNPYSQGKIDLWWMANDGWEEGSGLTEAPGATGITWDSLRDSFVGAQDQVLGTFDFNSAPGYSLTLSLALAPDLLDDVVAGGPVSIRLSAATEDVSAAFISRDSSTVAGRPSLSFVAIPEPGAGALLGLGALMALMWKRSGQVR